MSKQFPVPNDGETLTQYTIRCAGLADGMDPDDFNNVVWSTWKQSKGPTKEELLAERYFSPDKYHHEPGVCVFAEHKTTTANGKKRTYKLRDLANIVSCQNERISDVGAFPAISDGHTSNPGDANPRDPEILAYAGNYRLGRIGRDKPRWAIFQDEYQMNSAKPSLDKKPRRSVELWSFSDGRAHFDPIAAIGAEAPRLPLPQRFSTFRHEGAEIERYSFQASGGAFGSPGAGSTHVMTGPKTKKPVSKDTYAIDDEAKQNSAGPVGTAQPPVSLGDTEMPRLAPEDLQEIVAAIAETPQFKFITELMEREQLGAPGTDEEDLGVEIEEEQEAPVDEDDMSDIESILGSDDEEEEEFTPPGGELADGIGEPPVDELEDEEPEPEEKLGMAYSQKNEDAATVEKYTKLQSSHDRLLQDAAKMSDRIAHLERVNADNGRRRKIDELKGQFGDFIDVEDECKATLYSLGASMDNEQFDKHIASVEKYAERAAKSSVYIPTGDAPMAETSGPEKYSEAQAVSKRAIQIATTRRNKGETIDYDEAMTLARAELSK